MLPASCLLPACLLSVPCCLHGPVACYLLMLASQLLAACCLLPAWTYCLLLAAACCQLFAACCLLLAVSCLLPVACCLLATCCFAVCCLLAACFFSCLLPAGACCLLLLPPAAACRMPLAGPCCLLLAAFFDNIRYRASIRAVEMRASPHKPAHGLCRGVTRPTLDRLLSGGSIPWSILLLNRPSADTCCAQWNWVGRRMVRAHVPRGRRTLRVQGVRGGSAASRGGRNTSSHLTRRVCGVSGGVVAAVVEARMQWWPMGARVTVQLGHAVRSKRQQSVKVDRRRGTCGRVARLRLCRRIACVWMWKFAR